MIYRLFVLRDAIYISLFLLLSTDSHVFVAIHRCIYHIIRVKYIVHGFIQCYTVEVHRMYHNVSCMFYILIHVNGMGISCKI